MRKLSVRFLIAFCLFAGFTACAVKQVVEEKISEKKIETVKAEESAGKFVMKKELLNKHPRLFLTAEDLPKLREKAKTSNKWFVDEMERHFSMRVGAVPPESFEEMKKLQGESEFAWGFWRLVYLDLSYLLSGDTK